MSIADMPLYQAASYYAQLCYRVFPLAPHCKVPTAGMKWNLEATCDVGKVKRWWDRDHTYNIGLSTEGLVVLDVDLLNGKKDPNPWLTEERERELSKAPNQRTWSGGRQFIFRQPPGRHYRNTNADIAVGIDTRADGGYVVIAPSLVKEGKRSGYYSFPDGKELSVGPGRLPHPPEWLVKELDRVEANRTNGKPANGQQTNGKHHVNGANVIPEGQRNSTLTRMAGSMRHKAFDQDSITAALLSLNATHCNPPLPDAEVNRIAASVSRYDPSDPRMDSEGKPDVTYQRITAAELDAGDYSVEFLIENALVAGQPLIMAGGKKCMKTSILLDAAISLAIADPMLGTLEVNRGCRVAVMSGENGMATIRETCRRICWAKGTDLKNVTGLIFTPDLPHIGDVRHLDALERFILGDEIEVLAIDPAYLCIDVDGREASMFAMGEQLLALSELCTRNGVTLMLCHHTKKNLANPLAPPELEDIAWAGFQEFARQWWLVGRREKFDPDSDGHHKLWMNIGGSAGFCALWAVDITEGKLPASRRWEVALNHAAEARQEAVEQREQAKAADKSRKESAALESATDKIKNAMRAMDGHQGTKSEIKDRAVLSTAMLNEAIAYLLRIGKLFDCKVKRGNGQTYPGFRYEFDD